MRKIPKHSAFSESCNMLDRFFARLEDQERMLAILGDIARYKDAGTLLCLIGSSASGRTTFVSALDRALNEITHGARRVKLVDEDWRPATADMVVGGPVFVLEVDDHAAVPLEMKDLGLVRRLAIFHFDKTFDGISREEELINELAGYIFSILY